MVAKEEGGSVWILRTLFFLSDLYEWGLWAATFTSHIAKYKLVASCVQLVSFKPFLYSKHPSVICEVY
jgi:hypothetical protein